MLKGILSSFIKTFSLGNLKVILDVEERYHLERSHVGKYRKKIYGKFQSLFRNGFFFMISHSLNKIYNTSNINYLSILLISLQIILLKTIYKSPFDYFFPLSK